MTEDIQDRTWVDLVLGGLQVVVGLIILAHTVIATALSLLFVGWLLLVTGVVVIAACLFRIGKDGFWSGLVGGALMSVLGLVFLRHTAAAAVTLTLVAGALFLSVGIARLGAAASFPEQRVPLVLGGVVSLVLGLIVLFNIVGSSFTLLGALLGIQVLTDGITTMIVGRATRRAWAASDAASPAAATNPPGAPT